MIIWSNQTILTQICAGRTRQMLTVATKCGTSCESYLNQQKKRRAIKIIYCVSCGWRKKKKQLNPGLGRHAFEKKESRVRRSKETNARQSPYTRVHIYLYDIYIDIACDGQYIWCMCVRIVVKYCSGLVRYLADGLLLRRRRNVRVDGQAGDHERLRGQQSMAL